MPNIKDWQADEKLKILLIGPYKSGKTWGALTFPRPNVIDFDHGISVGRNPEFIKKYGLRNIEYEQFKEKSVDARGVAKTHNAFDDACKYFDKWMSPANRDNFDTWIIDSGTTMSEAAATKAMILLGGSTFGKPLSQTHAQAIASGLVIPKIQDYGAERSMVEQFVDMVKDTDKHVVFICHEAQRINDEGIVTEILPMLTGKSAQAIPLKFDEVWMLKIQKKGTEYVRTLQTKADSIRRCGSRTGLPDGTSWEWDAIQAELTKLRQQALLANTPASATTTPMENK